MCTHYRFGARCINQQNNTKSFSDTIYWTVLTNLSSWMRLYVTANFWNSRFQASLSKHTCKVDVCRRVSSAGGNKQYCYSPQKMEILCPKKENKIFNIHTARKCLKQKTVAAMWCNNGPFFPQKSFITMYQKMLQIQARYLATVPWYDLSIVWGHCVSC